jgi:hypothetical protein
VRTPGSVFEAALARIEPIDQLACEASTLVGTLVTVHQWFTRRALLLHLTVLVVVPTFLGLGWWQYHAALGGNELSWAYTFEWPFFAGYAVFVWWKMLHEQPGDTAARVRSARFAASPVGWAMTTHATSSLDATLHGYLCLL